MPITDQKRVRVVKIVAIVDLLLAAIILSYATFQFTYGENLIHGHMTRREKLVRLVVYACLHFCFLLIQGTMAIILFRSTSQLMEKPVANLQRFKTWRAWSSVYIVVLMVDAFFVALAMSHGIRGENGDDGARHRKIVSLSLLSVQICFRPIGILIVKGMEKLIEHDMGGVFKNPRSIIFDSS